MAFVESAILKLVDQVSGPLAKINANLRAFEAQSAKIASTLSAQNAKVATTYGRLGDAQARAATKGANVQVAAATKAAAVQERLDKQANARAINSAKVEERRRTAEVSAATKAAAVQERLDRESVQRALNSARVEERRREVETRAAERASRVQAAEAEKAARAQVRATQQVVVAQERADRVANQRALNSARIEGKRVLRDVNATDAAAAAEARAEARLADRLQTRSRHDARHIGRDALRGAGMSYQGASELTRGMEMMDRMPWLGGGGAVAALLAGSAAVHGVKATYKRGGEYEQIDAQMRARGFTDEGEVELGGRHIKGPLLDIAKANARAISDRYRTVSETEALRMQSDFASIFGDRSHSIEGAEASSRFLQFQKSWMGGEKAGGAHDQFMHEVEAGVRSGELLGKASDPKEMEKFYDVAKAMTVMYGSQARLSRILMAQRQAGGMFANTSEEFRLGVFGALVQETEGGGAGRQLSMLHRHVTGGKKLSDIEVGAASQYGLLEKKKTGQMGLVTDIDGFKEARDPDLYAKSLLLKLAEKEGVKFASKATDRITDQAAHEEAKQKLDPIIRSLFRDQNTQRFMSEMLIQWDKFEKDRRLGVDTSRRQRSGYFRDIEEGRTPGGAASKVHAQWERLLTSIGRMIQPAGQGIAEPLAAGLGELSKHPVGALMMGAGGAVAGVKGGMWALEKLTGAAELKVAAGALTGAAGALTRAAGAQALGGRLAAGAAAAGGVAGLRTAAIASGAVALTAAGRADALAKAGALGLGAALARPGLGAMAWGGLKAAGRFAMGPWGMAAMIGLPILDSVLGKVLGVDPSAWIAEQAKKLLFGAKGAAEKAADAAAKRAEAVDSLRLQVPAARHLDNMRQRLAQAQAEGDEAGARIASRLVEMANEHVQAIKSLDDRVKTVHHARQWLDKAGERARAADKAQKAAAEQQQTLDDAMTGQVTVPDAVQKSAPPPGAEPRPDLSPPWYERMWNWMRGKEPPKEVPTEPGAEDNEFASLRRRAEEQASLSAGITADPFLQMQTAAAEASARKLGEFGAARIAEGIDGNASDAVGAMMLGADRYPNLGRFGDAQQMPGFGIEGTAGALTGVSGLEIPGLADIGPSIADAMIGGAGDAGSTLSAAMTDGAAGVGEQLSAALVSGADAVSGAGQAAAGSIEGGMQSGGSSAAGSIQAALEAGGASAAAQIAAVMHSVTVNVAGAASTPSRGGDTGQMVGTR